MSGFSVQELNRLLRLARQRPLSPAEEARLQEMLDDEDGRLAAAADQHLLDHYRAAGEQRRWSRAELNEIAGELERRAGHRGERPFWPVLRTGLALGAFALLLLAGFLLLGPLNNQPAVEPAAVSLQTATPTPLPTPSPTPQPTATLSPNHVYVDLFALPASSASLAVENPYTLTLAEVEELWPHPLYVPTQIQTTWEFVGAAINSEVEVLELAFRDTRPRTETVWVLSQAPALEDGALAPLPVSYTTLPDFEVTNVYDDRMGSVGAIPALFYQYEHVRQPDSTLEFIVYNSVTWELDGQHLTLTFPSDNLMPSSVVAGIAEKLLVTRYSR